MTQIIRYCSNSSKID